MSFGVIPMPEPSEPCDVAVLGAAGSVGLPMCTFLKMNPRVRTIRMWTQSNKLLRAHCEDISHIPSKTAVEFYASDCLADALRGVEVVVITAGVAHMRATMTRNDLLCHNIPIIYRLVSEVANVCPHARIVIVSNPPNGLVPVAAEILKSRGIYDSRKLFGSNMLDVARARSIFSGATGDHPEGDVAVFGGHDAQTMVPYFSEHKNNLSSGQLRTITEKVRSVGLDIVAMRDGVGSAALAPAWATADFVDKLLLARAGVENIVACAYVPSTLGLAPYFSSRVLLGTEGVRTCLPLGVLSEYEASLLDGALAALKGQIVEAESRAHELLRGTHASA